MKEKGNFHTALLKSKAFPKHVEIINFISKTLRIKAVFFSSQLLYKCDLFKGNARIRTVPYLL